MIVIVTIIIIIYIHICNFYNVLCIYLIYIYIYTDTTFFVASQIYAISCRIAAQHHCHLPLNVILLLLDFQRSFLQNMSWIESMFLIFCLFGFTESGIQTHIRNLKIYSRLAQKTTLLNLLWAHVSTRIERSGKSMWESRTLDLTISL